MACRGIATLGLVLWTVAGCSAVAVDDAEPRMAEDPADCEQFNRLYPPPEDSCEQWILVGSFCELAVPRETCDGADNDCDGKVDEDTLVVVEEELETTRAKVPKEVAFLPSGRGAAQTTLYTTEASDASSPYRLSAAAFNSSENSGTADLGANALTVGVSRLPTGGYVAAYRRPSCPNISLHTINNDGISIFGEPVSLEDSEQDSPLVSSCAFMTSNGEEFNSDVRHVSVDADSDFVLAAWVGINNRNLDNVSCSTSSALAPVFVNGIGHTNGVLDSSQNQVATRLGVSSDVSPPAVRSLGGHMFLVVYSGRAVSGDAGLQVVLVQASSDSGVNVRFELTLPTDDLIGDVSVGLGRQSDEEREVAVSYRSGCAVQSRVLVQRLTVGANEILAVGDPVRVTEGTTGQRLPSLVWSDRPHGWFVGWSEADTFLRGRQLDADGQVIGDVYELYNGTERGVRFGSTIQVIPEGVSAEINTVFRVTTYAETELNGPTFQHIPLSCR